MRLAACLLALLPLLAAARDTATVRLVPEQLHPGEPFRMEIAIASTDDFPGPALRIGSELPASEAIPLRFAGQRISSRNLTTLLVSGVAPESPGEHTIPGFTVTLAVRKVDVPATRLNVLPLPPGTKPGFARFAVEAPDRTLYVGESIPVRVVMTPGSTERIAGFYGIDARGEGLVCRNTGAYSRSNTEGPLQADLEVTPTQAGELELQVGGMALVESTGEKGGSRERPILFTRKLRVAHVPERERPADWTGAVGALEAGDANLSNPSPGIGEPTTLTLTVKGKGNLDRMLAPEVPHGDAWDVQPVSLPRASRTGNQRVFAYTLIPRLPGKLRTPEVRLSYFNPETARFVRLEFPALEATVTGQAPEKVDLVVVDPSAPAKTPAPTAGAELAEPQPRNGRSAPPLLAKPTTLVWTQLCLALVVAGGLAWAARRDWLARRPELVRRRAARANLRSARRRMRLAERKGDAEAHAGAAVAALRAGASGRAGSVGEALTAEDVLRAAPELAAPQAVRDAFRRADGTRFGGQRPADTLPLHADLERCLAQMESHLCD